MRPLFSISCAVLLAFRAHAAEPAPVSSKKGIQFFEDKIRPILVKDCYSCHSAEAKKVKGGLLLDTKQGLLEGGESGPAIVPGKPVESLLIKALRHDGMEMPPKEKLPDDVIANFEAWVRMGAPDPRNRNSERGIRNAELNIEEGRKFWSFQQPRNHPVPGVNDKSWPRTDIDRFLLAAMDAKGVVPARDREPRTLLRRITIDLTGLPPTPEEIEAFLKEYAARPKTALEELVDRLLKSPAYGERWGRHWLDVARYADSNGRDENLTFHEAFRFRDYVIDSFNKDKPFDQFIREQIAGDLMSADTQALKDEYLTGSGFLILGPKVLADRDKEKRRMDVIDEQIETVGRAFMGMTLGCARCHDHKFDPVPQTDYYALAGIFGSTHTLDSFKVGNPVVSGWTLRPMGGPDAEQKLVAVREHQKKLTALADQIKKAKADLRGHEDRATMRLPGSLIGITVDDKEAKVVGSWKASVFSKPYVGAGYIHDDKMDKGQKSVTFTPKLPRAGEYEVFLSYTAAKGRSTNTPVTIKHAGGEETLKVNQEESPKVDSLFRSLGKFKFEAGEKGSVTISNNGTEGYVIVDAVRFVPLGTLDEKEMAMGVPNEVRQKIADAQANVKKLEAEEADLKKHAPPSPTLVMAARDEEKIANAKINVRGNPHQLGPEVPRGFLQVATYGTPPKVPEKQSGRLELAQWLSSKDNPLPARVYVNRVWKHLFGEGLVRTVDNFGIQGEAPTNQALLDTLTVQFVEQGWSTKKLIREIVLSRTYQLSVAKPHSADPENRLFSRANRKRVEAEVIRDTMLIVAGKLDRTMGGSAVSSLGERALDNESKGGINTDANVRRSIYLPVLRNELPQIFQVFDFADPDVSTGERDETTVPTQSLFLMNSPFIMDLSRQAARRLSELKTDEERVKDLYVRALGREPDKDEIETAIRFVQSQLEKSAVKSGVKSALPPEIDAWAAVCRAVFGCTEFRFVE